jgi:hypothetical protein
MPRLKPNLLLAQVPGQLAAASGAIAAHQDRLELRGNGELSEGEVDQLDEVLGGTGRGVARPQQPGQRLARRAAAVQVGQQWVKSEGVLVGARRAFLVVAVRGHQGGVHIDDQQVHRRVAAGRPDPTAGMCPGQGGHVGEVAYPQLVGPAGGELPVDQVRRPDRGWITDRGAVSLAADHAGDAQGSHEPPDLVAANRSPWRWSWRQSLRTP